MNNTKDRNVLRRLAGEYFNLSQQERFRENRKLHRAVNDLKPVRPVVLIDELPWAEMNINDEMTLRCEDPIMRGVEWHMRASCRTVAEEERGSRYPWCGWSGYTALS